MPKAMIKAGLVMGMAAMLSSCAWLGIGRHEPRIQALSTVPTTDEALVEFELGRLALDSGNYAEAIASFSAARIEPGLLASSLNGMGVAYARLGREDLAERYFREAAAAAPEDNRYAANLLRLQQSIEAGQRRELLARLSSRDVPDPASSLASSGQVRLLTNGRTPQLAAVEAAPSTVRITANRVMLSSVVSETPRNGAQVRLRFVSRDGQHSATYPIRVAFADPDHTESAGDADNVYPVRVRMSQ